MLCDILILGKDAKNGPKDGGGGGETPPPTPHTGPNDGQGSGGAAVALGMVKARR